MRYSAVVLKSKKNLHADTEPIWAAVIISFRVQGDRISSPWWSTATESPAVKPPNQAFPAPVTSTTLWASKFEWYAAVQDMWGIWVSVEGEFDKTSVPRDPERKQIRGTWVPFCLIREYHSRAIRSIKSDFSWSVFTMISVKKDADSSWLGLKTSTSWHTWRAASRFSGYFE